MEIIIFIAIKVLEVLNIEYYCYELKRAEVCQSLT